MELSIGLEYKNDEEVESLTEYLKQLADMALSRYAGNTEIVGWVEGELRRGYPDRAFFIETERENRGVQVFQPYGVPRG